MNNIFIRSVKISSLHDEGYPFSIPAVKHIDSVDFNAPITILVGENGSGKPTIIEAIAVAAGFNAEGGTKNYQFSCHDTTSPLSEAITLVRGSARERYGYFLRAETFYTTASYTQTGLGPTPILYDGKFLHQKSHGEAFMAIIKSFQPGLFILDEPESALSLQRQLSLMVAMHELIAKGSQFIIATHSPIILSYPDANIYQLSNEGAEHIAYDEADHVRLTKDFLDNPSQYFTHLFNS